MMVYDPICYIEEEYQREYRFVIDNIKIIIFIFGAFKISVIITI